MESLDVNRDLHNKRDEGAQQQSHEPMELKDKLVRYSFYITYAFLMTTATVTFIEAIRTKDVKVRNILNLETCISIVAAFFYGVFIKKINDEGLNYKEINLNRYLDWAITTPIMLLVLVLAFAYNNKQKVTLTSYLIILLLNYAMLFSGFLGENNVIDKLQANMVGFTFFAGMYYYIYKTHIQKYKIFDNNILFYSFLILWSFYGMSYWLDEESRNISYNILDLFAKCFVGIFFWAYFTKAIVLKK